jgi:DNA-binding XRE family transcriptional regulator
MKYYPAREVLDELMDKSLTPGRVIKATRARYKLTQKKLAEITGLKTTFISAVGK